MIHDWAQIVGADHNLRSADPRRQAHTKSWVCADIQMQSAERCVRQAYHDAERTLTRIGNAVTAITSVPGVIDEKRSNQDH